MKQRIITGAILGVCLIVLIRLGTIPFTILTIALTGLTLMEVFQMAKGKQPKRIVFFATVYILIGFYSFYQMRIEQGSFFILIILFTIWATDSGAYFIGKKIGKHKLAPTISPKKTIEGAVGGLLTACIVAFVFQVFHPVFASMIEWAIVIFITSISGQIGDLIQSKIKRTFGVKDSGKILPGHGGIFDRFDSLIFVFFVLLILDCLALY